MMLFRRKQPPQPIGVNPKHRTLPVINVHPIAVCGTCNFTLYRHTKVCAGYNSFTPSHQPHDCPLRDPDWLDVLTKQLNRE